MKKRKQTPLMTAKTMDGGLLCKAAENKKDERFKSEVQIYGIQTQTKTDETITLSLCFAP